jgi:short-subunit dehydrogenase
MSKRTFQNNSIVVTGASQGIGRELALQLAEQGASLTLAARNVDLLNQVASLCNQKGGKAIAVIADISQRDQCNVLIERANEEYGRIDTLINNAGIGINSRFDELKDISVGEKVMQVNFWGSIYCTYYALPYLKATQGRIVVINSGGGGKFVTPNASFYGASKHALVGFFDSLRLELENSGVTITTIYPDWVATGISTRSLGSDGKPIGIMVSHEKGALQADLCAKAIIKAVEKRKRDFYMSSKIKLGIVLKPLFPKMIDQISRGFFE